MLSAAADLLFPLTCAGCGRPGGTLCPTCAALLAGPARPVRPDPAPPGMPPCAAVAAYAGPVRAMLLAYKERARAALAGPLAVALAGAVGVVAGAQPVLLVPVPSRPDAVRRRGEDPVLRLARRAVRPLGVGGRDCAARDLLWLTRRTADSAGLSATHRRANLSGAIAVRAGRLARAPSLPVVLVDDLVTTGASLAEAARALAAAGRPPMGAATIAATGRNGRRDVGGRD